MQLCWDSRQVVRSTPPKIPLQINPDALDFRDATSMFYFQEFLSLVQGPWTTAAYNTDLWEVTLPQLARNSNTLRYAAIAIGAMSKWHQQSMYKSLRTVSMPAVPTAEEDPHYFHAVAYYCHSLKLQSHQGSIQDAIVLSVLSLAFEMLRGNRRAGLDHVNHGLALLLSLLTDEEAARQVASVAPNPKQLLGAVADVFTHLASQARTILRGRVGHGPSLPNLAKGLKQKKQTMDSFLVILSELGPAPAAISIDTIPDVFNTLDEFGQYWAATRRHHTALTKIMTDVMNDTDTISTNNEESISKFYAELLGNKRLRDFCDTSRKATHQLDTAFRPLFNRVLMGDPSSPDYIRAIHLRLQFLGMAVFEDPPQYLQVATLEARTPLFREYLTLASLALRTLFFKRGDDDDDNNGETTVVAAVNPAHQLSLQCGIAWNLFITALFCRDPPTRDEAIHLLRDYPGHDGLWDTRALYALALKNRAVERDNCAAGTPAEQWRRLWRREFVFEDAGERVVLRFMARDEDTGGEWALVEEAADVRTRVEDVRWVRQPIRGQSWLLMADLYADKF